MKRYAFIFAILVLISANSYAVKFKHCYTDSYTYKPKEDTSPSVKSLNVKQNIKNIITNRVLHAGCPISISKKRATMRVYHLIEARDPAIKFKKPTACIYQTTEVLENGQLKFYKATCGF